MAAFLHRGLTMDSKQRRYVLVSPAKNEEAYIGLTALSVTRQDLPPVRWIVVSDGSTDRTDDIVGDYARRYPFVRLVRLSGDATRNFGAQVRAIQRGMEELKGLEYDYIGNLDADVSFDADYYARIITRFEADAGLGIAGGFIHEQKNGNGGFRDPGFNSVRSVAHAVQLFRRKCYEDIGGYRPLRFGGADTVAEEMARMKGWRVASFADAVVRHHKPVLTGEGFMRGAFRQGQMDHAMGTLPLYEVLRCMRRIGLHRFGVYPVTRLAGYCWQWIKKEGYDMEPEFVLFLRSEQKKRIWRST